MIRNFKKKNKIKNRLRRTSEYSPGPLDQVQDLVGKCPTKVTKNRHLNEPYHKGGGKQAH